MTRDEVIDLINLACPHCRGGNPPRERDDTEEWVHDIIKGPHVTHTMCMADGIRKKYAVVLDG